MVTGFQQTMLRANFMKPATFRAGIIHGRGDRRKTIPDRPRLPDVPKSVVGRVLLILKVFQEGPEWSLSEISEAVGLPLSTTYRLVTEMHDGGLLSRTSNKRFRIGPLVLALAQNRRPTP